MTIGHRRLFLMNKDILWQFIFIFLFHEIDIIMLFVRIYFILLVSHLKSWDCLNKLITIRQYFYVFYDTEIRSSPFYVCMVDKIEYILYTIIMDFTFSIRSIYVVERGNPFIHFSFFFIFSFLLWLLFWLIIFYEPHIFSHSNTY